MDRRQRPTKRQRSHAAPRPGRPRILLAGAGLGLAALVIGVALVASGAFEGSDGGSPAAISIAPAHVAGIEVAVPWADQGHVPLDTPVQQRYTLINTSAQVVTLGKPSIEVLEGC